MSLKRYHEKRDFKKTAEPAGKKKSSRSKDLYLIQKHAASHLHYDLRLELDGVLKSWAVPKGPSLDPSNKRLAVHVEDHPLEYGSFEGIIPAGEYGGGTVMLWDTGTWQAEDDDPRKAYYKGNLTFTIKGKKLKGSWKLVQIKSSPKNWLLIKIKDKYARPASEYDITEKKPLSAVTRKTMDKIAGVAPPRPKKKAKIKLEFTKKRRMPTVIYPELATLVSTPPPNEFWLHEIKFDGYRLICFIKNNKIRLITRGQQDWTDYFNSIAVALKKLKLPDVILDGEITVLDKNQKSNFQLLQNLLNKQGSGTLVYQLFDILYYEGYDLTLEPLIKRKALLEQLLPSKNQIIRYSDHVIGDGKIVYKQACKLGLEGIVSKAINSLYVQKRTREWQKVKCCKRQEFVVGGYTKPGGTRSHFGSLLLGYYTKEGTLRYAGNVGTGFSEATLSSMMSLLQKYATKTNPFDTKTPRMSQVTWVKPKIVVEIEFSEWTSEKILRHPSFKGIRMDKKPQEVKMEKTRHG